MDPHRQEMAIEMVYNLGNLSNFPKFSTGLRNNRWDIVAKEYRRGFRTPSGDFKFLEKRNRLYYNTFIRPFHQKLPLLP